MTQHHRLIKLNQAMNFRDLGGYQTHDGHTVKWGRLFRADSLSNLDSHDQKVMEGLHIQTVCDLRSRFEQHLAPDLVPDSMTVIDCHVYPEDYDENEQLSAANLPQGRTAFANIYQSTLLSTHSQAMFARVLHAILDLPDQAALVFHCSAGKDRTGMMAALILTLLGVDDDTIIRDYLLTNQLYDFAAGRQLPDDTEMGKLVAKMNLTRGDGPIMQNFLASIRAGWGSADHFAQERLQLTSEQLAQLKARFLE